MEISKKTLRNIFLCAAGCIILYWLLHETERMKSLVKAGIHVVSPFVVGAAMAFILNVPMRGIERLLKPIKQNGLRRAVAIVLTLLVIVLVLAGVIELLVPQLISTVESLVETIPEFFGRRFNSRPLRVLAAITAIGP